MSCWHRTAVLRIPASALGFKYMREWNKFLEEHTDEFRWEVGCFCESCSDIMPWDLKWSLGNYDDPDWQLDQRVSTRSEIVPGPFLDYYLMDDYPYLRDEKSLHPEYSSYGDDDVTSPLDKSEMEDFLPLYQKLFPHFTLIHMEAVRFCEFDWYDGANAPYLYSDLDCVQDR